MNAYRRRFLQPWMIVCWVAWASAASSVLAADASPTIESAALGFRNQYKPGYWNPVEVNLRGGSEPFRGHVDIILPDGDGVATRYSQPSSPPIELAAGETKTVRRMAKVGRASGTLTVELVQDGQAVARAEFSATEIAEPVAADREWIATFGAGAGVAEAVGGRSRFASRIAMCELTSPEQIPEHWLALESLDTLVASTTDLAPWQALTEQQLQSLTDWVLNGGRLIWSMGRHGKEMLGEGSRYASLAPGRYAESSVLRNLAPLETFAAAAQRLEGDAQSAGMPITVLADFEGKVELAEASGAKRPLIIRTPRGLGQIVFVAFDLDTPPLAEWEGRSRILNRILSGAESLAERRTKVTEPSAHVARFGYDDMVGQLRSGLDQFPEVTFVPFSWIAGLVLLYLLLVVPVDYFFLRDVVRRMPFTWITFPAITLVFIGLALWLGSRWKGSELRLNQLDLVDVDTATGHCRGTTWSHLYSPQPDTYQARLALAPALASAIKLEGNVLAWQGLPGAGLGGLNTAAAAPPAINEYRLALTMPSPPGAGPMVGELDGIPVQIAATKSLLGRWWGEAELAEKSELTVDVDGLLRGRLVNPLPVALNECVVYFENWAFRLDSTRGTLLPGESTRIENEKALNLQWRLTGRRVIETKDLSTPWDQHTLEVPQVLQMMMFHRAAGGENYTQLMNRFQSYVDLSPHITTGRAILIGRAEGSASELMLSERVQTADRQWTYYRVVFPVAGAR